MNGVLGPNVVLPVAQVREQDLVNAISQNQKMEGRPARNKALAKPPKLKSVMNSHVQISPHPHLFRKHSHQLSPV